MAPITVLPACWKIFMSLTKLGAYTAGFPGPPDRQGRIPAAVRKEPCRPGSCARRHRLPANVASHSKGRHILMTIAFRGVCRGSPLEETALGATGRLGTGRREAGKHKEGTRTRGWRLSLRLALVRPGTTLSYLDGSIRAFEVGRILPTTQMRALRLCKGW